MGDLERYFPGYVIRIGNDTSDADFAEYADSCVRNVLIRNMEEGCAIEKVPVTFDSIGNGIGQQYTEMIEGMIRKRDQKPLDQNALTTIFSDSVVDSSVFSELEAFLNTCCSGKTIDLSKFRKNKATDVIRKETRKIFNCPVSVFCEQRINVYSEPAKTYPNGYRLQYLTKNLFEYRDNRYQVVPGTLKNITVFINPYFMSFLTPRELIAVLLHEVGHSAIYLTGMEKTISLASSLGLYNAMEALSEFLVSDSTHQISTNLALQAGIEFRNATKTTTSSANVVIGTLVTLGELLKLTLRYISMNAWVVLNVLKRGVVPTMMSTILAGFGDVAFSAFTRFMTNDDKDEEFANAFAAIHGYGDALFSATTKADTHMGLTGFFKLKPGLFLDLFAIIGATVSSLTQIVGLSSEKSSGKELSEMIQNLRMVRKTLSDDSNEMCARYIQNLEATYERQQAEANNGGILQKIASGISAIGDHIRLRLPNFTSTTERFVKMVTNK